MVLDLVQKVRAIRKVQFDRLNRRRRRGRSQRRKREGGRVREGVRFGDVQDVEIPDDIFGRDFGGVHIDDLKVQNIRAFQNRY